jgi:hypothetical protein
VEQLRVPPDIRTMARGSQQAARTRSVRFHEPDLHEDGEAVPEAPAKSGGAAVFGGVGPSDGRRAQQYVLRATGIHQQRHLPISWMVSLFPRISRANAGGIPRFTVLGASGSARNGRPNVIWDGSEAGLWFLRDRPSL